MMAGADDKEWRHLTFSQRTGKAPLPEALQAGKLTTKFRNQVWVVIGNSIGDSTHTPFFDVVFDSSTEGKYWQKFISSYNLDVQNIPHDKIKTPTPHELEEWLRNIITGGEVHEVITLLEHMLRLSNTPKKLANKIEKCFEFAPYLIDRSSNPVCIIPTISEEMKENVKRALANINQSELTGVKQHLGKATQELNNNNFAGSIRESIHAVESATRQIDTKKSTSFSTALNSLEKSGIHIHPALQGAFKKLYGYTNSEQGIRHPLIDADVANVGFDEAIFMYGACVSFVDYLASKKKQLESQ